MAIITLVAYFAAFSVAFLMGFYALYVLVMGIYRAHLAGLMRWHHYALLWWVVVLGILLDVIANVVYASFVFREWPQEFLVTTRLERYKNGPDGWRKYLAIEICTGLLDLFDPSGMHCHKYATTAKE